MNHTNTCGSERNCVWRVAKFLRSRGSGLAPWDLCVGMVGGEPCASRAKVMVGKFDDPNGMSHPGHPFCPEHARLIAASFDSIKREAAERKRVGKPRMVASEFEGTVYFGVVGDRVKIGYSVNAYKRRRGIETSAGIRFDHFQWMMGDREDERRLLKQFAEYRTVGEWFKADPVVLAGLHREFTQRAA